MTIPRKRKRGRPAGVGMKLTGAQVSDIKKRYYTTTPAPSLRKLGKEFGVSHQTIFLIVNGAMWAPSV